MPMNPRLLRPVTSGFHPEAQVWRNAVIANGGTVSGSTLNAVSRFCRSIDAAGIRDRFYRLNLFCGNSDASLNAVRTPLYRGPSLAGTQYGNTTDTNNNFVEGDYAETGSSGGLLGNGSSKRLATGLNATILPDTTTSGHLSVYAAGTYTSGIAIGVYTSVSTPSFTVTFTMEIQLLSTGGANTFINTNANAAAPTASSPQFFVVSRTSSTSAFGYTNGTAGTENTTTATNTAPANQFLVFARNQNNFPSVYFAQRLRAYSIGEGMTGSQVAAFNNAMQTFQAALGRNV
jgi:hypothetical protein